MEKNRIIDVLQVKAGLLDTVLTKNSLMLQALRVFDKEDPVVKIEALYSELKQFNYENRELKAKLSNAETEVMQLNIQLKEIPKLESQIKNQILQNVILQKYIGQNSTELEELKNTNTHLLDSLQIQRIEAAGPKFFVEQVSLKNENLTKQNLQLQQTIDLLKAELMSAKQDLDSKFDELNQVKLEKMKLQEDIQKVSAGYKNLKATNQTLQDQNVFLQQKNKQEFDEFNIEKQKGLNSEQLTNKQLGEQLEELQKQYSKFKIDVFGFLDKCGLQSNDVIKCGSLLNVILEKIQKVVPKQYKTLREFILSD